MQSHGTKNPSSQSPLLQTIDVSSIIDVGAPSEGAKFTEKELGRCFEIKTGNEQTQMTTWFLAADAEKKSTWIDGIVLAGHFEGKESSQLIQEIMDLFVVETELDLIAKDAGDKPPVPMRPENLNFVGGPIRGRN